MQRIMINNLNNYINEQVLIKGWIASIRRLKSVTFLILRDRSGLIQCVIDNKILNLSISLESSVEIVGTIVLNRNDLNPYEINVERFSLISQATTPLPIEINKKDLDVTLDTMLNNRMLSLRHEKINSIFKIQNIISNGFREFLNNKGFTEISTPKIVKEGAEGGSEIFKLKYFENDAYLCQSPQFYKQIMVGAGFERVFEIGHVYRAEEHNTSRHLNEYISMDLEIGFIDDESELMDLEEELLKYILDKINKEGKRILNNFQVQIPKINNIPRIELDEAIKIVNMEYGKSNPEGDLDPEGEKLICKYAKEKFNSDFIFLTHYPRSKRPMYTMPNGKFQTNSFDLLFKGIEITTGGQRIHDYDMLIDNIKYKGLNPDNYRSYTENFKYGMPPHGGLAIGLERITCQVLGLKNIREASLIPRDRTRLIP
ncbi:aspartate--tRNA(Asn) ligase [Clostridium sp. SHJSY1]|uniref:aspartate--tRNA(Asn) ligase n=1 Tax=Clostridium sp. SHJSY1 TaxID=2942483 RepID=UPI0028770893|nr:aspartate--tRNA(Asn) ligase [Clostridium sp. SHJSY1]MDS0524592.1 aspartate--tRNA(Asn) ligase [Clostridium sp. SHJSY1]